MTTLPVDAAARLTLALALGMLLGFEREWANKDLGLRTFALVALLGLLAASLGQALTLGLLAGVLLLIALVNVRELRLGLGLEITTSAALLLTFVLGLLVGEGRVFVPVMAAVLAMLLLTWKLELRRFVGQVHPEEIRAAVWLAILAGVIYPLLPNRFIDRWDLVNPRAVWMAVIVVAAVGFVNYILMRLYSARGLLYGAVLGGAVSSAATMVELGGSLRAAAGADGNASPALIQLSVPAALLGTAAMLGRNLLLLLIFAPAAWAHGGLPLVAMAGAAAGLAQMLRTRQASPGELKLSSPVSLRRVFEFGALFLAVEVAGSLGDRYFGHYGFYGVSVLGGIFNSASTTVAAGQLAHSGALSPATAGMATVLASITSAVANTILMNREIRNPAAGRKLRLFTLATVGAGIAALLALATVR